MITPPTRRRCALVALLTLALTAFSTPLRSAHAACDAQTSARLDFLEARLEEGRRGAAWWWRGWLTVFSVGAVLQSTKAVLSRYDGHDADLLVSAGKSLLGVTDLTMHPLVAKNGADAARAIPTDSFENCARRLAVAESTLDQAARQAQTRYSWTRHLSSLALNLGAAVLVGEAWDDRGTAWESFAVSETSSEGFIWSQPWSAVGDWKSYRTKFDGAPLVGTGNQWSLAARPGGVGILWKF